MYKKKKKGGKEKLNKSDAEPGKVKPKQAAKQKKLPTFTDDDEPSQRGRTAQFSDLNGDPDAVKPLAYPKCIKYLLLVTWIQSIAGNFTLFLTDNFALDKLYSNAALVDQSASLAFHCLPVVIAYLADTKYGRYKVEVVVFTTFICSMLLLLIGTATAQVVVIIIALILKRCMHGASTILIAAFGADQFQLPEQGKQLRFFVIWFVLGYEAGRGVAKVIFYYSNLSIAGCAKGQPCYVLFGLSITIMLLALVVLLVKFRDTVKWMPDEETKYRPWRMTKCYFYAIRMVFAKYKMRAEDWLYRADAKYGSTTVYHLRAVINIWCLFATFPILWALSIIQYSLWSELSESLQCMVGPLILYPDQINELSVIFLVLWLLAMRWVIISIMYYNGLKLPLQYIICGAFMIVIASMTSVVLSLGAEHARPHSRIPDKRSQLRIYNPTNCSFRIEAPDLTNSLIVIKRMDVCAFTHLRMENKLWVNYTLFTKCPLIFPVYGQLNLTEKEAVGYYFRVDSLVYFQDDVSITENGQPKIRILANVEPSDETALTFVQSREISFEAKLNNITQKTIYPGTYRVKENKFVIKYGEIGVMLYNKLNNKSLYKYRTITSANSISVVFAAPQYMLATLGKVMIVVSGVDMLYKESPDSMRTTFLSIWYQVKGIGTLLTLFFDVLQVFRLVSQNLVLYTLIMLTATLVFVVNAVMYHYVDENRY